MRFYNTDVAILNSAGELCPTHTLVTPSEKQGTRVFIHLAAPGVVNSPAAPACCP